MFKKYVALNRESMLILNKLQTRDIVEGGKKSRECKEGFYIDKALLLLAEKEGIAIE